MREAHKIFTLLLLFLMLGLAACSGGSPNVPAAPADATPMAAAPSSTSSAPVQTDAETVRVGIILYGETQSHLDMVEAELNRLLKEHGSAAQIEFVVVPAAGNWNDAGAYHQIEMRKEDNDKFDIMPSYVWDENYGELVEGGFVLDLTDYLLQYPDLVAMNNERAWQEATVDGRTYWVPLVKNPGGTGYSDRLSVDEAVLKALDRDFPRTFDEMRAILREAKAAGLPYKIRTFFDNAPYFLHRTYSEWPFFVDRDSLMIYYADGTMEPYIESDVFDKDNALIQQLDEEGLIMWFNNETFASVTSSSAPKDAAMIMMGGTEGMAEDVVTITGRLEPERPISRNLPFSSGALFLPTQCRNPELALELINTIYTNDEIYLTWAYGLEGEDWEFMDDGTIHQVAVVGAHDMFEHHTISDRYRSQEELLAREEGATQDFPFSAFAHRNDPYKISAALRACLQGIYDLRDGSLPAEAKEDVVQRLNENGFRELFEDWEARYEEYKALQ